MTDRTPESIWDDIKQSTDIPEPGEGGDCELGMGGDPEPLPTGDAEHEEDF